MSIQDYLSGSEIISNLQFISSYKNPGSSEWLQALMSDLKNWELCEDSSSLKIF